jgi:hypothetical protein
MEHVQKKQRVMSSNVPKTLGVCNQQVTLPGVVLFLCFWNSATLQMNCFKWFLWICPWKKWVELRVYVLFRSCWMSETKQVSKQWSTVTTEVFLYFAKDISHGTSSFLPTWWTQLQRTRTNQDSLCKHNWFWEVSKNSSIYISFISSLFKCLVHQRMHCIQRSSNRNVKRRRALCRLPQSNECSLLILMLFEGCDCNMNCSNTDDCSCVTKSRSTFFFFFILSFKMNAFFSWSLILREVLAYTKDKRILLIDKDGTEVVHFLLYECIPECGCDTSCPLRVVQLGIFLQLQVFRFRFCFHLCFYL